MISEQCHTPRRGTIAHENGGRNRDRYRSVLRIPSRYRRRPGRFRFPVLFSEQSLTRPGAHPVTHENGRSYPHFDRGREGRLVSAPPPSEPDVRISRIRLSGRWFTSLRIDRQTQGLARDHTVSWIARQRTPRIDSSETRQHGESTMTSVLHRALVEKAPTGLALRHSRQWFFYSSPGSPSTSLRSLCSIPITGLHRYYGRSDSCPVGSSVALWQHEHRLCSEQVSLLNAPELPIPPSPTTRQSLDVAFARYPSAHRVSQSPGSRLPLSLAGSPALAGRIEFVILRMDRSPPAAPHPASRRRSCSRLQAGERMPEGDFHPSVQYYIMCARRRTSPRFQAGE